MAVMVPPVPMTATLGFALMMLPRPEQLAE